MVGALECRMLWIRRVLLAIAFPLLIVVAVSDFFTPRKRDLPRTAICFAEASAILALVWFLAEPYVPLVLVPAIAGSLYFATETDRKERRAGILFVVTSLGLSCLWIYRTSSI